MPGNTLFDSLACLLQVNDVCGAVCFDGEKLIFANNSITTTSYLNYIINELTNIAQKGYDIKTICAKNPNPKYKNSHRQLYNDFKKSSSQKAEEIINQARTYLYQGNKCYAAKPRLYKDDFNRSIKKVIRAIYGAYFPDFFRDGFPLDRKDFGEYLFNEAIIEALRSNAIVFIISPRYQNVHCELQIVDYLIANKKTNSNDCFYIGVSKKCCLYCQSVIDAYNDEIGYKKFSYRKKGHGYLFSATNRPPFLQLKKTTLPKQLVNSINEKSIGLVNDAINENPEKNLTYSKSNFNIFLLSNEQKKLYVQPEELLHTASSPYEDPGNIKSSNEPPPLDDENFPPLATKTSQKPGNKSNSTSTLWQSFRAKR